MNYQVEGKPNPLDYAQAVRLLRKRVVVGGGLFSVVKNQHYRHQGLKRGAAVKLTENILHDLGAGGEVGVKDARGDAVFDAKVAAMVYQNPLRDCVGLFPERIDMGVDYGVHKDSPVYSLGEGVVVSYMVKSSWPGAGGASGTGSYIAVRLTNGPAAGKLSYDAEHITLNPKLKLGSKVTSDTVIATHHPGFANCEMGWANPSIPGDPLAFSCYNEGALTGAGENYDNLMRALGAPACLRQGRNTVCPVGAGFPREWKGLV